MEKKNGLGILYLFTFGLFGIGWLVDILKSIPGTNQSNYQDQIPQEKSPSFSRSNNNYNEVEYESQQQDPNRIQFSVAGVTFYNDDGTSRQQILKTFYEKRGYSKKDITLQRYKHEGNDALYVIARGYIIGNVPKEYIKVLVDNLDTLKIYHFRVKMNNKGIYYSVIDLFLK